MAGPSWVAARSPGGRSRFSVMTTSVGARTHTLVGNGRRIAGATDMLTGMIAILAGLGRRGPFRGTVAGRITPVALPSVAYRRERRTA